MRVLTFHTCSVALLSCALFTLLIVATACGVVPGFEQRPLVWMSVTYDGANSDLTAQYSLPPPPPGTVYVVWALTQDYSKTAKVGVVPPGVSRGAVSARVGFRVDGVLISLEDSPEVTRIGENRGVVDVGIRR
ncbi:MAG: hypothetical protein HY689_06225 [Chloroflexi bacterium]|nr:hypothetical protein [Chloroflexota bacterium]